MTASSHSRTKAFLALCAMSAVMARFGKVSDRWDLGVLVSPLLLADRQTLTTPG